MLSISPMSRLICSTSSNEPKRDHSGSLVQMDKNICYRIPMTLSRKLINSEQAACFKHRRRPVIDVLHEVEEELANDHNQSDEEASTDR